MGSAASRHRWGPGPQPDARAFSPAPGRHGQGRSGTLYRRGLPALVFELSLSCHYKSRRQHRPTLGAQCRAVRADEEQQGRLGSGRKGNRWPSLSLRRGALAAGSCPRPVVPGQCCGTRDAGLSRHHRPAGDNVVPSPASARRRRAMVCGKSGRACRRGGHGHPQVSPRHGRHRDAQGGVGARQMAGPSRTKLRRFRRAAGRHLRHAWRIVAQQRLSGRPGLHDSLRPAGGHRCAGGLALQEPRALDNPRRRLLAQLRQPRRSAPAAGLRCGRWQRNPGAHPQRRHGDRNFGQRKGSGGRGHHQAGHLHARSVGGGRRRKARAARPVVQLGCAAVAAPDFHRGELRCRDAVPAPGGNDPVAHR